jgi:ERCC4-type nuclease
MNSTIQTLLVIVADHREQQSGIPGLLLKSGAKVNLRQLRTGDYIINDEMVVERKSAEKIRVFVSGT